MDNEIQAYVYNHLGLKGTNATKRLGHLISCAPYGEDYEALESYLKSLTKKSGANKGRRSYSDSSVNTIVKEHKSYIEYRKGQHALNNNENIITSQETQEHIDANITSTSLTEENITSKEFTSTVGGGIEAADPKLIPQISEKHSEPQNTILFEEANKSTVETQIREKHKGGRPISTNRSERFTLYMNADVLKEITTLANLDNLTVTDLMNNLLTSYVDKRRKDIEFMEQLERMKAEYKQNRTKED